MPNIAKDRSWPTLIVGDSFFGQPNQLAELIIVEGGFFTGSLDLDESTLAGHHDIHVDVGCHIPLVIEVELDFAVHEADADRGDRIGKWPITDG